MAKPKRRLHLGVFWLGTGNHSAGWRWEGAAKTNFDLSVILQGAKTAERGKFDLFFISDGLSFDAGDHPSFVSRFEPTTLVGALGALTSHVGLGATVSTSFSDPYTVARTFGSLQHLTKGRAAWNIVTSSYDSAALNFSQEKLPAHDERYAIASEFVDVVRGLWNCWEPGAIVADPQTGQYLDAAKIHRLDHKGKYFQVRGPLNMEHSPYGPPGLIQAGGSPPGQELSARTADLVFAVVNGDPASAKKAYDSLKSRVVKHGRDPSTVKLLPGVMPIVGRTDAEAKDKLDRLQSWLSPTNALTLVSQRIGHDLTGYPLDGPVPEIPADISGHQTFSQTLLDLARREKMTLRDLYNVAAAARGHWVIYGSPIRIADTMQEWFESERADGFVVMPPYFPGAFDDFVDLVVPELQRRGIFRAEYAGATLRDHLAQ